jgi:type 1 fimbria pilin
MKKQLYLIMALALLNAGGVQAANTDLTLTVTANIQPGTCYFDSTALTFDFGTVYPAAIMSTDKTKRPYVDREVTAVMNNTSSDMAARHSACDASSTAMNFKIDAKSQAQGADDEDVIALSTDAVQTGTMAAGFGISVYRLVDTTETLVSLNNDTDVGDPGDFTLRARLVPLKGATGASITGGYINAQATLSISYQ